MSYLAADYPEIEELDINRLIVTPRRCNCTRCPYCVDEKIMKKPVKEYSHLILRPYPESLIITSNLKDGY
jgi:acetyltransferase